MHLLYRAAEFDKTGKTNEILYVFAWNDILHVTYYLCLHGEIPT